MTRRALFLALLAASLAACGAPPAPNAPRPTRVKAAAGPLVPGPTDGLADAPVADADLQARVTAAVARLDAVRNIRGRLAFRESKGSATDNGDAKIGFRRKPFAARVDIVESNRALAHGGSLLWTGGTTLRIKPLGLPLSVEFAWDNGQVVSLRGWRIDQTDIFSMGTVLRHPQARLRAVGTKRVRNEELFCVEAISPGSLAGITREVIGIHAVHGIPTYREMYEGSRLVHQGQGYQLQVDRPIEAGYFEL